MATSRSAANMRLVAHRAATCGDRCPSCQGLCDLVSSHCGRFSSPHCCSVCGARWSNWNEDTKDESGPEAA